MCGIYFSLFPQNNPPKDSIDKLRRLILNRGPDCFNETTNNLDDFWSCHILASTLWTQGSVPRQQPVKSSDGSFLLWNGDVFSSLEAEDLCDSDRVFALLHHGIGALAQICGPYSFVYYYAPERKLWIGRDVIGRHSLLWRLESDSILVASVSLKDSNLMEVPSYGLYSVLLNAPFLVEMHPWSHFDGSYYNNLKLNITLEIKPPINHKVLGNCVNYDWLGKDPPNEEVMNILANFTGDYNSVFSTLLKDNSASLLLDDLKRLLIESVKTRVETQPKFCSDCSLHQSVCNHCKTAVCFSGGLDSSLIALICNEFVPESDPIDLYNVAFEHPRTSKFDVPDRITGRLSYEQLKKLAPNRTWNFIEIDITQDELCDLRKKHIADLIHPLDSILDDSLGCALWFAVRGIGKVNGLSYTSKARVVLLGMGADELFGGYSKHKSAFINLGWSGLGEQLILDTRSIGRRNLGRDNRVAADHGRQPRMPFLDEHFYAFVDKIPPWYRSHPGHVNRGLGAKYLLRLLAWKMGLSHAASMPKKALQFGSRIASSNENGHMVSNRLK